MSNHCRRFLSAAAVLLSPAIAAAQQPAVVTGRVTNEAGTPLQSASVFVEGLGLGTLTREDGQYSFVVPAARLQGQQATLTARVIGYRAQSRQITLSAGEISQNFTLAANPLNLGEVVVTGAGTQTEAEKLGNVRNNVSAEQIQRSNESNIVQALAAKAPNVEVTSSSGEPGASSYIRMRGQRTILGGTQPLFVVDGVPIDNSSFSTSNFNPTDELGTGEISGTAQMNRAIDINPDDIENIEILKGPAAAAIYGARAGQGVVLITTKKGRAGQTRYSWRSTLSWDDINKTYPLQRTWGQGRFGASALPCNDINKATCLRSWGPSLAGKQTFDHSDEAYDTGHIFEQAMSVSGGNERTTFYLSGSYTDNNGVFVGPNNEFQRTTVRLNASHRLFESLNISGNVAYADTRGQFVQRGNNVNGLQLGLLRTPPDFNNLPYLDPETGLHRSYRLQTPGASSSSSSRGFDNPFFVLYEPENRSRVGRVFGNVGAEWVATNWLRLNYTLGTDYSNDERLEGAPQPSSDVSAGGRVTEGNVTAFQIDHNLTATGNYRLAPWASGTVTLGQNINVEEARQISVVGRTLVAPAPYKLQNTVSRDIPIDNETNIHRESYFGQATLDLWDQLFLTGALRNDGSSTFGADNRRNYYPKGSASWTFTNYLGGMNNVVTFGKLRAAYGEAGTEPGAYLTQTVFNGSTLLGGISQGTGLQPSLGGLGGLYSAITKGNPNLKPERTKETEVGFDLGLIRDKADLSFTYYDSKTEDVILLTPLATSTGFFRQAQNSARFSNKGLEVSLNVRPVTRANFSWDVGFQWARNRSEVLDLQGVEFVDLQTPAGIFTNAAIKGQPIGVFYDFGWVKCGITPDDTPVSDDQTIGQVCSAANARRGALFIDEDGFPIGDDTRRIVGDPNPDWTGSIRTGITFRKIQVSGLFDIREGGDIYNGTLGALRSYGTAKETEVRATCTSTGCTGNERTFGEGGWYDGPTVGPGAGQAVPIGENWWRQNPASDNCAFSGYGEACIEDGSYVKLREVSVGYRWEAPWVRRALGLSSVDFRVSGRNLKTWSDYKGYDPETNLGGAIQSSRGQDYFNMPQTRSFVLTFGLNR
ncbi:MAG: SusC/RagA family TonB-linked outer membrane protein [Gemmatimonadaceae bacterium]